MFLFIFYIFIIIFMLIFKKKIKGIFFIKNNLCLIFFVLKITKKKFQMQYIFCKRNKYIYIGYLYKNRDLLFHTQPHVTVVQLNLQICIPFFCSFLIKLHIDNLITNHKCINLFPTIFPHKCHICVIFTCSKKISE